MSNEVIEAEVVSQSQTIRASESNQNALAKRDDKAYWLTEPERFALEYFQKNYQKGGASSYPIAPSTQAQLFALFLNGKSLDEIRRLNHPSFSLGQIVHAAIDGNWEIHRREYLDGLMAKARERLQQIGCESLNFMADSLAAAHKQHGEALSKYLQSGNPNDLGPFGIGSIRQYKEVLELLLKASGAEKTSNLNVKGMIEHVSGDPIPPVGSSGCKGGTLLELAAQKKAKELK